jgi:peroxiredoxin
MFKKALYASAAVLMSASLAFAADIGKPAPDFKATDIAGKAQSVSQYKGKIVVLEWNNPGCPFVHKHYDTQNMQKLQEYAASKGVVWISVNSGAKGKQGNMTPEEAKEHLAESKAHPSSYILDESGAIGHLYEAKTTPHMFVIDAKGTLVYKGAIDDKASANHDDIEGAKNYVRAAIDALAAGKTPEVTETKSYGCSVKY